MKPAQERDTFHGCRPLSRCKQAAASQVYDLFKPRHRVAADIESTVESHGFPTGRLDKSPHGGHVDVAIGQQGTAYEPIDKGLGLSHVALHHGYLVLLIDEVALTWPDKQVNGEIWSTVPDGLNHAYRRGQPAKRECGA